MKKKQKGFTLIELIAVVVILGILVGVGVPMYVNLSQKTRENSLKSALATIRAAISLEHSKNLLEDTRAWPATVTASMFEQNIVPFDPFPTGGSNAVDVVTQNPVVVKDDDGGWLYNSSTGEVRCDNSTYIVW
ncbi:MAG: prepilin-type N-terminal cleavage/methylation domain-containing protein [bacterium]|nr:prepilin-type N-terminal cleavage/methylation domain-containing protein [bacterium]